MTKYLAALEYWNMKRSSSKKVNWSQLCVAVIVLINTEGIMME